MLGKAEFQNPGGSVKDRAALYVVKDAEDKGLLRPGGTVVEGTAGNTGIGLAHVCRSKGSKLVVSSLSSAFPHILNESLTHIHKGEESESVLIVSLSRFEALPVSHSPGVLFLVCTTDTAII